jgi:spore coat-associated protein N
VRLALVCAALVCAALLLDAPGSGAAREARVAASLAGGSVSIVNSRQGAAIFQAEGIGPGDSAAGTVTISNTGTLDGVLLLGQDSIADVSGPGGGALSGRLDLVVRDVTSAPAALWTGKLAAMPPLNLGPLGAGASRTFEFTASLPHGVGDDAFAGSAMSSRFLWTAVAAPSRDPGPRVRLRVPPIQRIISRRYFVAYPSCNEPCRIKAYADLPAGRGRRARTKTLKTGRLPAGRKARLVFRLPSRSVKVMRRALARGNPTSLTLTIIATDDGGNTLVVKRRVEFSPISRRHRARVPTSAG